jgi:hypothetical protein
MQLSSRQDASELFPTHVGHPHHALVAAADADAQLHSEREQRLMWLDVLGRLLVAAGQLLQQVPQRVSASGDFVLEDRVFPEAH